MQLFRAFFFRHRANIGDFLPKREGSRAEPSKCATIATNGNSILCTERNRQTCGKTHGEESTTEGARVTTTPTKERVLRALEAREGGARLGRPASTRAGRHAQLGLEGRERAATRGLPHRRHDESRLRPFARRTICSPLRASAASCPPTRRLLPTVRKSLDSTNAEALRRAVDGAPEGTVIVAEEQTAGRGRRGRSFFSPAGTGIYLSILVRPALAAGARRTCSRAVQR